MEIEIKCAYDEMVALERLVEMRDPKNRNQHPPEQIDELCEQFKFQGVRHPIIISKRSKVFAAGDGRFQAAEKLKMPAFPVNYQDFESEEQEYAFRIADNAIQGWSKLDLAGIHLDLPQLAPFEIERLAIPNFQFEPLESSKEPEESEEERESRLEREYEGLEFATKGEGLSFRIAKGDCLETLKSLQTNSLDSMVTDPPAGISFMGKDWDGDKGGRDEWIRWLSTVMSEAMRVLKPGAHALVWALPRTSHWTATALEDAGFEIRDVVTHLFGSGFPKSHDISKAIDRAAGVEREVVGLRKSPYTSTNRNASEAMGKHNVEVGDDGYEVHSITAPATDAAKQWDGWGTALKPASENWILCRKPVEGTIAENVLKWGVGGLNIDACRIAGAPRTTQNGNKITNSQGMFTMGESGFRPAAPTGRFPANLVLDEVAAEMLDEQSGELGNNVRAKKTGENSNGLTGWKGTETNPPNDSGGASRFFYCAKPAVSERNAGLGDAPIIAEDVLGDDGGTFQGLSNSCVPQKNFHPTVKPVRLMRYFVRLITPPNGTVLDPFSGSGTTGIAALAEGMKFLGCEQDEKFVSIAVARIASAFPEAEEGE